MGYTLKLDVTDYERNALVTLLTTQVEKAQRNGTARTPFHVALAGILDEVAVYEVTVTEARREAREARQAILRRLADAAGRWEDTVGAHEGAHIDAGDDMRDAARQLVDGPGV